MSISGPLSKTKIEYTEDMLDFLFVRKPLEVMERIRIEDQKIKEELQRCVKPHQFAINYGMPADELPSDHESEEEEKGDFNSSSSVEQISKQIKRLSIDIEPQKEEVIQIQPDWAPTFIPPSSKSDILINLINENKIPAIIAYLWNNPHLINVPFDPSTSPLVKRRCTPLDFAVATNKVDLVKLFLLLGGRSIPNETSAFLFATGHGYQHMFGFILAAESRFSVDEQDKDGKTAAMIAVLDKKYPTLLELLKTYKANPNIKCFEKRRDALYYASNTTKAMVVALLDHGAVIDSTDYRGTTALMNAVRQRNLEIVVTLVDLKANVHLEGRIGYTAICYSMQNPVEYLLALTKNANLRLPKKSGITFAHMAILDNKPNHLYILLKAGAPRDLKDNYGLTIEEYGRLIGNPQVTAILQLKTEEPDYSAPSSKLLHTAARKCHSERLKELLQEKSIDIFEKDEGGFFALEVVPNHKFCSTETVALLKDRCELLLNWNRARQDWAGNLQDKYPKYIKSRVAQLKKNGFKKHFFP